MDDNRTNILAGDDLLDGIDAIKAEALMGDDLLTGVEEAALESSGEDVAGKLKSLAGGIAEGSTLGFADELGGATQSGLDILQGILGDSVTDVDSQLAEQGFTGDLTTDSSELYKQAKGETVEDLDAAAKANPLTNVAGQMVGGITTGIVGGGLLPGVAKVGKVASAASKAMQAAKATALEGGVYGAIQGAGDSEADMSEGTKAYLNELTGDITDGASTGMVLGGVLGATANLGKDAAKFIGKWVNNHIATGHMKEAFKAGVEGFNINPTSYKAKIDPNRARYSMKKDIAVSNLGDKIKQTDELLGSRIGDSINKAEKNGVVIKVDKELENAFKNIEGLEQTFMTDTGERAALGLKDILGRVKTATKIGEDDLQMIVTAVKNGDMPPELIRDVIAARSGGLAPTKAKDILKDVELYIEHFTSKQKLGTGSSRVVKQLKDFKNMLRTKIGNQVEGYNNAATKFKTFRERMPETLLTKKQLRGNNPKIKDMKKENIIDNINDVIEDTAEGVAIGQEGIQQDKIANITKYLDDLKQSGDSEVLHSMGYNSGDDFVNQMDELQKMVGANAKSHGATLLDKNRSTTIGSGIVDLGLSAGQGLNYRAINAAGRATQSPTLKTMGSLYNASKKTLSDAVGKLSNTNSKNLNQLGKKLKDSLAKKDDTARKAILFVILQNPEARKALGYNLKKEE